MVLEFQVDGPLSCREDDLLDGLTTRNLVDLSDILPKQSGSRLQTMRSVYAPDEQTDPRRLDPVHDGERATQECELHGRNGTSQHLVDA